jgi:hypothetical protein
VTHLDPPAAAARRQYVLDRIVEDLVGWGCPLDHAEPRARHLLDRVLDGGYRLPASIADAPHPPAASTTAGRTRARLLWVHHRIADGTAEHVDRWARCACRWEGPTRPHAAEVEPDHLAHLAAMLVVGGVATAAEMARARPERGPGAPNRGGAVPEDPRNAPAGTEGVAR